MKRHPALIPLSREHHQILLLAQLLKKDAPPYKGLPTDTEGKIAYARDLFSSLINHHMAREEEQLFSYLVGKNQELEVLCEDLRKDHQEIRSLFQQLESTQDQRETTDQLGRLLERHVRQEERVFFEMIQEKLDEPALQEIAGILNA